MDQRGPASADAGTGDAALLAVALAAAAVASLITACSGSSDNGGPRPRRPRRRARAARQPTGPERASATRTAPTPLPPLPDDVALPIVFVHGFAGSAQQYESQAMRFVANGYPQERIVAYDHDGAGIDIEGYTAGLDEVVDDALAEFDVEQVYLVGHSRGTIVSSAYLGDPAQAAKVAKYVAIDGAPCPDVVPCVAPDQEDVPRPVPRRGRHVEGVVRRCSTSSSSARRPRSSTSCPSATRSCSPAGR